MRYIGAISVILSVFFVWRGYSEFLFTELWSVRAFLKALTDYRDKIKCYLEPSAIWASKYEDEILSSTGFLDALRRGDNFYDAYSKARSDTYLSEKADEVLSDCFGRLGEGYLDTELRALEYGIERLSAEESRVAENLSKRQKSAGALLGAFAVGLVIMII